jgi:hypothetical protein
LRRAWTEGLNSGNVTTLDLARLKAEGRRRLEGTDSSKLP